MDASTSSGSPLALSISDDGIYTAHVNGKDLVVCSEPESENKEVQVARIRENGVKALKFFRAQTPARVANGVGEQRLFTTNDSRISIWQLQPLQLLAEIENVEPGSLNIEFGGDESEILVFHAWNTKLTIHSVDSGRTSVIKSPKFTHSLGFGYRPWTKQLAILLKPEISDLLTIHEPETYELISRVTLPTIDAQGLKWSPDGKWIAIWDVASAGTKVLIFTADGQLFRTYTSSTGSDDAFDLGVKQIEWGPVTEGSGVSEVLAVGKVNGNIDLLRTRTFSSSTILSHVFYTEQYSPSIWRERFTSALGDGEYVEASASSAFNMSPESAGPSRGISIMTFSPDGALLATVDSMRSNVVWIWALDDTTRLTSILVHEQPVRQLVWHSTISQLLINTVMNNLPSIRWWSPKNHPVIARISTQRNESGKYEVRWLAESDHDSVFWFTSSEEAVLGYLEFERNPVQFKILNLVTSQGYGAHGGSLMN
ncbi:hypothetical protein N7462_006104 [Penicillium macrosclerotiorum]|uniref:uncharacterized protein n=1 Tax=Penicillium macrosclerotiorum TaxID=303699 RepID=UPI002548344E|nr:uncharacterized protein N7462_006104 [Penicillium macrosclerotiorum]KAJ5682939.1 hypothetical protein N7462_006104 [Penicillium macrosclerotiorum]